MKPIVHAKNSVKKWGGIVNDYLEIHEWFDSTKKCLPDMRHRMILHNSFGIYLAAEIFGDYFENSEGKTVSTRDIGEQHVIDDLGHIPTIEKCFQSMSIQPWMCGRVPKNFKIID